MRTRVRKLLIFFLVLLLASAGLVYYVWQQSFKLPDKLVNRVREFARSFHDIDFDTESLKINFPEHTIHARNLKVMLPGEKAFIEASEATVFLASGTGPLDLYFTRAVIEKIEFNGLKFDATAPRPENASGEVSIFRIPAREVLINGLNLDTSVSVFNLPDFKARFIRNRRNANLEMSFSKGPVGGTGHLIAMLGLDTGEASINFNWRQDDFSSFIPLIFLSHRYGLNITSGGASISLNYRGNLVKRLRAPSADLPRLLNKELTGSLGINSCNFNWAGIQCKTDIKLVKEDNAPWKGSFAADTASGSLKVSGEWLGNEEKLTSFQAEASCHNFSLNKQMFELLDIKLANTDPGSIDFDGNFSGNIDVMTGSGTAQARNWKYQNKLVELADFNWVLNDQHAVSMNGGMVTELGDLLASSTFFVSGARKGQGSIAGDLDKIDLQKLKPFIEAPVGGKCSGPFKIVFDLQHPASTTYDMRLVMEEGKFYSFAPDQLSARVFGTGKDWNLSNPVASFRDGGLISFDGLITSEKFAANVNVENVDLSVFSIPGRIASGVATLKASIGGPLLHPVVKGDLISENPSIMGIPVESFRSQLSVHGTTLTLAPVVIKQSENGMLDGFFSIDLLNGDLKSFRLSFQRLPVSVISGFLPGGLAELVTDGGLSGSVSFGRQNGRNVWNFLVEGHKLVLAGENIESIYLEGNTLAKQTEIKSFFVRAFGGNLNLTGQINASDKFNGSLEIESLQFEKFAMLRARFPGLAGELNAQGAIEWDGTKRSGAFTVFTRNMKTQNRDLGNFGGEISVDDAGLQVKSGEFDKLGLKITGDLDWRGRQPYSATLEMNKVDLSFIPEFYGVKTFDYGGLLATGKCQVQGDLVTISPDLINLHFDSLRIQKENDVIVSNRPIEVIYQNNGVEIRSLELKYRQGILGVEGVFTPGKNAALMLNGRNFSVKALGRLFDLPNWNYDGSLSAEARLFGDLDKIKLKASAQIEEFVAGGRKIPEIKAKIDGDRTGIDIADAFVKLNSSSFNLKGRVDFAENFVPSNINLHLFVPQGPISDLAVYLPEVIREANGSVKADLTLVGNPASPEIAGDLHLTAEELAFSSMRKPLTKVDFLISTDDRVINIDRLEANLGRGKLFGTGQVDFRDSMGSITAHISGQKLDLSFMNLEISNASAGVNIRGDLYNPILAGKIFVPRGKFNLTSDLLAKRKPIDFVFNSLNYHFDVEVPRNFWLKSSFLNSEMRGKFSISGDLENMKLDGGISCVQGKLYFKQRQFLIETGEIKFGGVDNSFDPQIYVKSEGQIQSTKVFLTLHGRVSSFTTQIYSTPPMEEGDLLALLTLGRDLNTAMHSDSKELFETEILEGLKNSYISALIGSTISTALNLDELFLSSLFDRTSGKSRAYIRVGKYIGKNIFMAYEGTMEQGQEESYIFEYRLPKGFVVNIEFKEPVKEQRIGVRSDWKFW